MESFPALRIALLLAALVGVFGCQKDEEAMTPARCDATGGIWDANHSECHDDQTAPRALDQYHVPDHRPK